MKITATALVIGVLALAASDPASGSDVTILDAIIHPDDARTTPAERAIERARKVIERKPTNPRGWCALAMACARRGRETSDPDWYAKADEALDRALKVAPEDYEARRTRIWVRLGQHRFSEALSLAQAMNKEAPDDILVYGFLTDAHVELGQYAEAEKAAQWMLDMRPGNVPGLTRGAYLRELWGDVDGAVEFMRKAYQRTRSSEKGDRAWLLTHIAHLELGRGRIAIAERIVRQALALFPDYHYALAELGKIHTAQSRHDDAVTVLRKRYEIAPHPENLLDLAHALRLAGNTDEAKKAFATFEEGAAGESDNDDNCNRELVRYWVDVAGQPAKAAALARKMIAKQRDIATLHVAAWALSGNGEHEAAGRLVDEALAVGAQDATLLYHAGIIAGRLGEPRIARKRLERSLEVNPLSPVAGSARRALAIR